jgi:hypothetical protein
MMKKRGIRAIRLRNVVAEQTCFRLNYCVVLRINLIRSIAQAQLAQKKVQEYVRNRLSELRDECVEMHALMWW